MYENKKNKVCKMRVIFWTMPNSSTHLIVHIANNIWVLFSKARRKLKLHSGFNVPLAMFQEAFFTFEFFTVSVCFMGNALLWFVSVLVGGGDTYVIYYECMDTACLFIDVSCVYVGFLSPPPPLLLHVRTHVCVRT